MLALGFARVFSSSTTKRWGPLSIFIGHTIIALFALSALVAGWNLDRLQTLLLEVSIPLYKTEYVQLTEPTKVFVLLVTCLCLIRRIYRYAAKIATVQAHPHTAGSRIETTTTFSHTSHQSRPQTRHVKPNDDAWDMEAYAEAISEGTQTWWSLRIPVTPVPAMASRELEMIRN